MTNTHPASFFDAQTIGTTPYYAIHFLPKSQQEPMRNLLDLWTELESTLMIPDRSVQIAKLNWWSGEIQRAFDSTATHPLTTKLQQDLSRYNLPQDYFLEIIDGFAMAGNFHHPTDERERDLYLQRTGGIPTLLMAEVCGYQHRTTPKIVQILGSQLRLIYLIRTTPTQRANGLVFFTQNELSTHQLSVNDLSAPVTSENLAILTSKVLTDTCEQLIATTRYLDPQDFICLSPLLSWIRMETALAKEIQKEGHKILEKYTELSALRKLWLTWKSHRQLKKGRLPF